VLQFNPDKCCFEKVHQETYGKTGVRRIVPGQYISSDPMGRAFMISAVEKQKFVYIMNRDSENKLTISSPLDAHKSHTVVYDTCGVDVGHENPLFAVLESDYGEIDEFDAAVITGEIKKNLTYYEMDLGLNHVIRKSTSAVDQSATNLLAVPHGRNGKDGPGGVFILCEDVLFYRSYPPGTELKCKYPKRLGITTGDKVLINCACLHKQKGLFFYLLQTEHGDLLKVNLAFTEKEVHSVSIQYFDTIHPCNSICLLKTGYLFAAADTGNQYLRLI
jgi:splicing factor 3B subunit 3